MESATQLDATAGSAPRPAWPKACRCGEIWSRTEWPELTPVGRYLAGSEGWIELRSCVCGVTLVVTAADLDERDSPAAEPVLAR
jgi:hypothetical protein